MTAYKIFLVIFLFAYPAIAQEWTTMRNDRNNTGVQPDGYSNISSFIQKWNVSVGSYVYGSPTIGDVNGDGYNDIVVLPNSHIIALNGSNGAQLWNYTLRGGYYESTCLIKDLNKDSKNEVACGNTNETFVLNGSTGTRLWNASITGYWTNSPNAYDVNGDGYEELFTGDWEGIIHAFNGSSGHSLWNYSTARRIEGSQPAIVDVDDDGRLEIIIATYGTVIGSVWCVDAQNGSLHWGWQYNSTPGVHATDFIYGAVAVGNLDTSDSALEGVFCSSTTTKWGHNGDLTVLNLENGTELWEDLLTEYCMASPALYDVNGDGKLEIIVNSASKTYGVYGNNGTIIWTANHGTEGSPSLADLNNDGAMEIVLSGYDVSGDRAAIINSSDGSIIDSINYFTDDAITTPGIGDIDNDTYLEIVMGDIDGNLYAFENDPAATTTTTSTTTTTTTTTTTSTTTTTRIETEDFPLQFVDRLGTAFISSKNVTRTENMFIAVALIPIAVIGAGVLIFAISVLIAIALQSTLGGTSK